MASEDPPPAAALGAAWVSTAFAERYRDGDVLGRGGMGEVRTARDRRVARDVAIKRMREPAPTPDQIARFLREARVQGGLEHPAVVPIHDVGLDADGRPFIVMKRVEGITLADILAGRAIDPFDSAPRTLGDLAQDRPARWSRRTLLGAFAQVCHAVDFAHSRGVVHRDLKPSNILLGWFGEVHVLDWGVARILDEPEPVRAGAARTPRVTDVDLPSSTDTAAGAVVGTPAYMAPEQRMGALDVDGRADVYSLGCVLFEILTGQSLAKQPAPATLATAPTMPPGPRLPDVEPLAVRFPDVDVPPELDALCLRALATDPAARIESARALHDEVQRYLDGDRDLALRRELAAEHVATAQHHLEAADVADRRAAAMREAGQALALDPSSTEAAAIVSRLMLEPPAQEPVEVGEALRRERQALLRAQAHSTWRMYAVYLACVPLLGLMGATSLAYPLALAGVMAAQIASIAVALRRDPLPERWIYGTFVGDLVALVLLTRIAGPLLLVPAQVTGMVGLYVRHTRTRRPALIAAALLATVVVPLGLELLGVLPASYTFADDAMTVHSDVAVLTPVATYAILLILLAANAFGQAALSATTRREHDTATRQLRLQSWHLAQLVRPPDQASAGGSASIRSSSPLRSRA